VRSRSVLELCFRFLAGSDTRDGGFPLIFAPEARWAIWWVNRGICLALCDGRGGLGIGRRSLRLRDLCRSELDLLCLLRLLWLKPAVYEIQASSLVLPRSGHGYRVIVGRHYIVSHLVVGLD
jgi:hypothetical protein